MKAIVFYNQLSSELKARSLFFCLILKNLSHILGHVIRGFSAHSLGCIGALVSNSCPHLESVAFKQAR
jgi:hypothetical protein